MNELLKVLSTEDFAHKWGLEAESTSQDRIPKKWGLAEIIRCELRRRGAMTRRELRKRLMPILETAGFDPQSTDAARELADDLAEIGEFSHVRIDGQKGWASRPSRWVQVGNRLGVVLGVAHTSSIKGPIREHQFVRRFDPTDASILSELSVQGIEEEPLEKWIGTPGWRDFTKIDNSVTSLDHLWHAQVQRLRESGDPFTPDDSKLLCVEPTPGKFFGMPSPGGQGRWTSPSRLPDGVYLGAQSGYGDSHWRPLLVELANTKGTSILLDAGLDSDATWELFCWLLIARGIAEGPEESIEIDSTAIQLTYPLPKQLTRFLKLIAESGNNWTFQASVGFQHQDWQNFYQLETRSF